MADALETARAGFLRKLKREGKCWIWTGCRTSDGYGVVKIKRKMIRAHRASYQLFVGPIPKGLVLDHRCRNRLCVRPSHLDPCTAAENTRRSNHYRVYVKKSHCPRGHSYEKFGFFNPGSGGNQCRMCRRADFRRYDAKHREKKRLYANARRERQKALQ